tara:strand:- start:82162 stop:82926 length:765 start_codon:yes stop_codon:yes gene_type:complete
MLKINQILSNWKSGDIHGLEWLAGYGVDRKLAYKYCKSGYLDKVAPGVFIKANEQPNPYSVIRYLQQEMNLKLHVSGRTALELQGHAHYLSMGNKNRIYLTSYESRTFPKWLKNYWGHFEVSFRKSSFLESEKFLTEHEVSDDYKVNVSARELAIMELIENFDLSNSLETIENYVESLTTLRSYLLQEILEECQSIKVKRVFLYVSEKLNLPYFKKLDFSKISLGSGKRVVVEGGVLDKKYNITVDRTVEENPF